MANCIECSSFDPYYKGGWCDCHECETSPSNSCPDGDYNGAHIDGNASKICRTCSSFCTTSRGEWCDYHECTVNGDSYCSDWS